MQFILDRKNYIAVYVIGYLLRGMIYHFFPLVNDALTWITVLWPAVLLIRDICRDNRKPDRLCWLLFSFLGIALISTLVNQSDYLTYEDATLKDALLSLWQNGCLLYFVFPALKDDRLEDIMLLYRRLAFAIVVFITLLMSASLILYICFQFKVVLPFSLASEARIFTFGHLGNERRFCGLFGYSTDGGNLSALCLILYLFLREQRQISDKMTFFGVMLSFVLIILLDVRTSILEVMCVALYYCILCSFKRFGRKKTAVILSGLLALGIFAIFIIKRDAISFYYSQFISEPAKTMSFLTTGRSKYWSRALREFKKEPFIGKGWINCNQIGFFDTHNLFINLLLWTGLTGFGLFGVFTVLGFLKIKNSFAYIRRKGLLSVVLIIIAVLIESMFDRAVLGTACNSVETIMFWLSLGILVYLPESIASSSDIAMK